MSKAYSAPQAFETAPRPPIKLEPLPKESRQIAQWGHDAETSTLALIFKSKGGPTAIYHFPNFSAESWEAFKSAESAGKFFGSVIKTLPFKKYPIEPESTK